MNLHIHLIYIHVPLLTPDVENRMTLGDNRRTLFVFVHKHVVTLVNPIIFVENIFKILL